MTNHTASTLPLFTIGVTTFDRPDLLRETLRSLSRQTFKDFEVIVGNDCVAKPLTAEALDLHDERIRIVNHPENLQEIGNMNTLLGLARGRYFSWLSDDDPCASNFLEAITDAIGRFPDAEAIFTDFRILMGTGPPDHHPAVIGDIRRMGGPTFLQGYLRRTLRTMVAYGVFRTASLRSIGGVRSLSSAPIGWNGEHLLAVQCGRLTEVAYVDAPLQYYRYHEDCWGGSDRQIHLREEAGKNLLAASIPILEQPELLADFRSNLSRLTSLVLDDIARTSAHAHRAGAFGRMRNFRRMLSSVFADVDPRFRRDASAVYRWASIQFPALATLYVLKRMVRGTLGRIGLLNVARSLRDRHLRDRLPSQN